MLVILRKRMISFPDPNLFTLTHSYLIILAGRNFIHEKSVVQQFSENVVERFFFLFIHMPIVHKEDIIY